jgi:FkbM family methyltransferase
MKYNKENDFWYLGDGDPYVFTEQKRDYGRAAERARGANVLDFGGHCGFFNLYLCRNHPPANITTVEPDPRARPVLEKNCRDDTDIISAAVVDDSRAQRTIPLYLGKTFMATNSVEPFRGREEIRVPTIGFRDLLISRKITFIKCDCEGGEYGLQWKRLPSRVHTVAIEFHFARAHWEQQMMDIDAILLAQGFHHIKAPKVNRFQKISTGLYAR